MSLIQKIIIASFNPGKRIDVKQIRHLKNFLMKTLVRSQCSTHNLIFLAAAFVLGFLSNKSVAQINIKELTLTLTSTDDDPGFTWGSEFVDDIEVFIENLNSSDYCEVESAYSDPFCAAIECVLDYNNATSTNSVYSTRKSPETWSQKLELHVSDEIDLYQHLQSGQDYHDPFLACFSISQGT